MYNSYVTAQVTYRMVRHWYYFPVSSLTVKARRKYSSSKKWRLQLFSFWIRKEANQYCSQVRRNVTCSFASSIGSGRGICRQNWWKQIIISRQFSVLTKEPATSTLWYILVVCSAHYKYDLTRFCFATLHPIRTSLFTFSGLPILI